MSSKPRNASDRVVHGKNWLVRLISRNKSWVILAWGCLCIGCEQSGDWQETAQNETKMALASMPGNQEEAVVCRGQLEPASGVVQVNAGTGDRVAELKVQEGDQVRQGDLMAVLESHQALLLELQIAETRLTEARKKQGSEEAIGKAKLNVARIGLQQAQLQLKHAEAELAQAEAPGGKLDLLAQEVRLAESKLNQLATAQRDPTAGRLVTNTSLQQQQLEVNKAKSELAMAKTKAQQQLESGRLAVRQAEEEIAAAETTLQSGLEAVSFRSAEQGIDLLRFKEKASLVVAPTDGTILAVDIHPGEATIGLPVIHMADTRRMVCRAEVDVAQIKYVQEGARVRILSPALPQPLEGTVAQISQLIGSPRLPPTNPLAKVDWRSVEVLVAIDREHTELAAAKIHLNVDVVIGASESEFSPSPDTGSEMQVNETEQNEVASESTVLDTKASP